MGGAASRIKQKDTGNISDTSDTVSFEALSEPSKKSEIQLKFGWYDSTDSDISELENWPIKKKDAKTTTDTSWKTILDSQVDGSGDKATPRLRSSLGDQLKVDQSTETRHSLKDCACDSSRTTDAFKDSSVTCTEENGIAKGKQKKKVRTVQQRRQIEILNSVLTLSSVPTSSSIVTSTSQDRTTNESTAKTISTTKKVTSRAVATSKRILASKVIPKSKVITTSRGVPSSKLNPAPYAIPTTAAIPVSTRITNSSTSTSYCYCTASSEVHNEDTTSTTETCTCTSHESTQTESDTQMNIDKKRTQLDRYSREPPERDQNYDTNYMKSSDARYAFEHNSCSRCPCKSQGECKVAHPSDYSHTQYSHGPHTSHGVHNTHGPHSLHNPHGIHTHNPHSPHPSHSPHSYSPHHMHNRQPYPNQQYNQPYQESYQQYNQPIQSSQSQSGSQGYNKPMYGPCSQQQSRRCPPPPNCERKRTTYDLAKSVENLRHAEHPKMNSHPPPSKTNSHSVPEVGKHKVMMKQEPLKSESSDNYGYVDYPNPNGSRYPYEEPNQDREERHERNCACEYCHHRRRNYFRNCSCCECRKQPYEEMSSFSEDSQNMNQNMKPRNLNLAYQKTDDYPVLVDEIETTISQRNKERVRNTMRQFELLSRQNKALEKPIYDDEEDDERCNPRHYPRHSSPGYNRCNDRCNAQSRNESLSNHPAFSATPFPRNKGYVEKVARYMDPSLSDNTQKYPKFNSEQTNSRWQMDPRTGEWYKVYEDNGYDFQNNYPPLPEPPMPQFREQDGYQKGPSNSSYYSPPPPSRSGNPNKHHHYPIHSKTCNCRGCMQHRY